MVVERLTLTPPLQDLLPHRTLIAYSHHPPLQPSSREHARQLSARLLALSVLCVGMSGRTLRRLPVLAHARYIGVAVGTLGRGEADDDESDAVMTSVEEWVEAMEWVVEDEKAQMVKVVEGSKTS